MAADFDPLFALGADLGGRDDDQLTLAEMQMTDDFLAGVETPLQAAALFSAEASSRMEPSCKKLQRRTPAALSACKPEAGAKVSPSGAVISSLQEQLRAKQLQIDALMQQQQLRQRDDEPDSARPNGDAPPQPPLPPQQPTRAPAAVLVDEFEAVVAATAAASGGIRGPFSPASAAAPDLDDDWAAIDEDVFGHALDFADMAALPLPLPPLALAATPTPFARARAGAAKRKLSSGSDGSDASFSTVPVDSPPPPRAANPRKRAKLGAAPAPLVRAATSASGASGLSELSAGSLGCGSSVHGGSVHGGSVNGGSDPATCGGADGKRVARRWTSEQDEELRQAVARFKGQNWKAIARLVTGRDHVQCLQRYRKVLQPGLVKGMWSAEEDALLVELMSCSRPKNWADIAARVPGRTAKQCRERWSLNLDPSIKRSAWTEREDDLLVELHARMGNRWAEIKRHLPGRTENGVKTRYKSIERARSKDEEVAWTPQLEKQLHDVAARFRGRIDDVAKHLPRALRGISSRAMRQHCALLRELETGAAAAGTPSVAAAAVQRL